VIATAVSFPPAPRAVRDALAPLLVIPLYRLVSPLVDRRWRRHRNAVFGLFFFDRLRDLLAPGVLLGRLLMGAELVAAIAVVVGLIRTLQARRREQEGARLGAFTAATRLALALLALALLAQVFGYVELSELVGEGLIRGGLVGLGLFAAARIAQLTLAVLLSTQRARAVPWLREVGPSLLRWGPRAIGWLATAGWAFLLLDYFGMYAPAKDLLVSALTTPVEVGTVSLSLGQVLGFLVTLLAALGFSTLLRALLEGALFPRLQLRRGIPQAVSTTLHYAVLLVGFLLALGAAGVDFSRFTLLAGAFGVGLGFGLQNVVSNFVSGLILLFERPIQIGDSVEVAGVQGEVRRIGIRSSTLRTRDGAEVIVPNAKLIENQVVNWTLSDQDRRIELRVGVAYGTEPRSVLEILLDVARAHPEVLPEPQPQALFLGFGESSLDFQLLAWTSNFAGSARIRSELGLAMHDALQGAGVEIPFPQRELRLRGAPGPSQPGPGQEA
jgi:small-conductance mechanosensitive channel